MTVALLEELRTKAQQGQVESALETIDEVEAAFAEDRVRTERIDTLATAVRFGSDSESPAAEAADAHLERATELEQSRIELNEAILNYVTGGGSSETLVERIESTIDAYHALDTARSDLITEAETVDLGVLVHLAPIDDRQVPKGDTAAITTTIENLGDTETGSLSVRLDGNSVVSTTLSPTSVGELPADDDRPVDIGLTGEATGRTRLRLVVEGSRRDSVQFRVEVLDKAGFLSRALSIEERLLGDVREREDSLRGLESRLRTIKEQLERLIEDVDQTDTPGLGQTNSIDNRIEAVIEKVESMIRTLETDKTIDVRTRREYIELANQVIDRLGSAVDAEK